LTLPSILELYMPHLVLLGDSIFDNGFYVPEEPAVIEQVRSALPSGWQATLLAIDGNVVEDVPRQLERLPRDATHLAVSAGGNDALRSSGLLSQAARSTAQAIARLAEVQNLFRSDYRSMLEAVHVTDLVAVVCTIYDAIPGLEPAAIAGLSLFNDVIVGEAARARIPALDLRLVCTEPHHYSPLSPIEPSSAGGKRIAASLARFITTHDFNRRECVVFS
jgi:hypothetical protein